MEEQTFCTSCGNTISSEDLYCPSCGTPVKGRPADEAMKAVYEKITERTITWAGIFLMIASIPSIIIGIDSIFNSANIAASLWDSMSDTLNISFDELVNWIRDFGYIELAIGSIGLLGAALCFMRRYWIVVVIITIFILFFGVASFFGLFLGLLAMWFVLSSKRGFKEYQKEA